MKFASREKVQPKLLKIPFVVFFFKCKGNDYFAKHYYPFIISA